MRSLHVVSRRSSRVAAAGGLLIVVAVSARALSAGGGTITGKVDATPPKYLEESVVYLKKVPGAHSPKTIPLDQKGMRFLPHVLTVTLGDTVQYLNRDNVDHNVFSPDHESYNLGMFKNNQTRTYTFKQEGVYTQLCSVHPEMLAYIFVGQNPYSAVVDKTGHFTIKNVPPGTYESAIWNPKLKAGDQSVT